MSAPLSSVPAFIEVILVALSRDPAEIDGMHGTVVIAGQAGGTPSVVQPHGRCTFYIIHRTNLLTLAALDALVGIDSEFLVVYHHAVEVCTDYIRVESGCRTLVEFCDATSVLLDEMDDVGQLMARHIEFLGFFILRVSLHKRQTDVTLGHDYRKHRLLQFLL